MDDLTYVLINADFANSINRTLVFLDDFKGPKNADWCDERDFWRGIQCLQPTTSTAC